MSDDYEDDDEEYQRYQRDIYSKMVDNQWALITRIRGLQWDWVIGGAEYWKDSDFEIKDRDGLVERVYAIMAREKIEPPACSRARNVMLDGEKYSKLWLAHYYNVRYFQPCRQVASFIAGRLTGEYHEGNEVSFELDLARLCAASKILGQRKQAASSTAKSKDRKYEPHLAVPPVPQGQSGSGV